VLLPGLLGTCSALVPGAQGCKCACQFCCNMTCAEVKSLSGYCKINCLTSKRGPHACQAGNSSEPWPEVR